MRERKLCGLAAVGIWVLIGLHALAQEQSPATETDPDKLNQQIAQLYNAGKYSEAIPIATKLLELREKTLGPEHPDTGRSHNNLATLYAEVRDYAKAEPLFQRALQISEKGFGPEHPNTATCLDNLGELYDNIADYAKAESFYQRALQISEKTLGPEHPDTGPRLNILARLYGQLGDYAKAERLFQRALQVSEKAFGPEHANTATSLNNLALLYSSRAEYAKAEPLFQRSLQISEQALGAEHPRTATSVSNLGGLYLAMGDYSKAERLYQRALKIYEKEVGADDPRTATSLNNLAELYSSMGEDTKAEPLFQRALQISEKVFGPEHPGTATALNNLAMLCSRMGDYPKAESLLQRALRISEKTLGSNHPDTANNLNNLASLYERMGDSAKAEPLAERALKICEKVFGPDHPRTATSLTNSALLYIARGDVTESLRLARLAQHGEEKTLSHILSFTSEEQRLIFQRTTRPYTVFAILGHARKLAETVLRRKGVVLDSLLEDRLIAEASGDARQHEAVTKLRADKQQLMKLLLEAPQDPSEEALGVREAKKKELAQQVEELEAGLARHVTGLGRARRALSVTLPQVQAALDKDQALIELFRYQHFLGPIKWQSRYGAVVITQHEAKWVALGAATEIEKSVQLYQKSARGKTDQTTLGKVLRSLHAQVWEPIEKVLPSGTTKVIVSPDAELNFVSFATLVGPDDKFVAEKYSVHYVASGRDLLRQTNTSGNKETDVYANADFASQAKAPTSARDPAVALRSIEMRDLRSISLSPLPGTATEAAALEKRPGITKLFLGPKATEAELRKVNAPRVLHLATHGFFLPEMELAKDQTSAIEREQDIPKAQLVNPMHRSGLALSGAQSTLQAWSNGNVPPIENDGIVTAEEVGDLNLEGTDLVVLSACETGSGEARVGEGVMGLRRGFIQAGAKNLLMTLWPISDEITVKIMLDFYDASDKSHNPPQALADVQRDWLVKLRKEKGLLAAVRLAGPFIMSSQGKH
jgi:CHAT domain-containing protein/Tfp pilus assembly protein PilF